MFHRSRLADLQMQTKTKPNKTRSRSGPAEEQAQAKGQFDYLSEGEGKKMICYYNFHLCCLIFS